MKIYKKMVRFCVGFGGWMGCAYEEKPLTDWMNEEEADLKRPELKEMYRGSMADLVERTKYVEIDN